jgi:hypothetical protein
MNCPSDHGILNDPIAAIIARHPEAFDERQRPVCGVWDPLLGPCICGDPANHVPKPACDTCNDTGLVDWMIEGDPNCYQEPDSDGKISCPDCGTARASADTISGVCGG